MRLIEKPSWAGIRGAMAALGVAACLSACAAPNPPPVVVAPPEPEAVVPPHVIKKAHGPVFSQTGIASWYKKTRGHTRTANGERLIKGELTAAHRSLPMNTIVRVTNLTNGRSVQVRINDRGPFVRGRVIDLSPAAADDLGMKKTGLAPVRLDVFADEQARSSPLATAAN
jgi:peptidoglycan lytic transglycosylase